MPEKIPVAAPGEQLDALLAHPLSILFATIVAAWLAARVVQDQVRRLRAFDAPGRTADAGAFDWPALFSMLVFWLVLSLGLFAAASQRDARALGALLEGGAALLLRLLLAAVVLAGATRLGATLAETAPEADAPTREAARRERRTVVVIGAALAAAAATGLSVGTCIAIALVAGPLAFLLRHPEHRARAAGWLADLAAGLRLRELEPASRRREGLEVPGKIGLLRTWVVEGAGAGEKRLVRNEALLERLTAPTA